jgi:hypothetical protein
MLKTSPLRNMWLVWRQWFTDDIPSATSSTQLELQRSVQNAQSLINCLALITTTLHLPAVANPIADVDGVIYPYSKAGLASLAD